MLYWYSNTTVSDHGHKPSHILHSSLFFLITPPHTFALLFLFPSNPQTHTFPSSTLVTYTLHCVFLCVEDVVDLSLVKIGLATLLQKNIMAAMDGIFSQVRERVTQRGGVSEGGVWEGAMGYSDRTCSCSRREEGWEVGATIHSLCQVYLYPFH